MSRSLSPDRWPIAPRSAAALLLLPLLAPLAAAQEEAGDDDEPTALVVSPQAEPEPTLRYRLFPSAAELNPGDAAPVYLRLYAETPTEAKRQIFEKTAAWLDLPMDDFPAEEARAFVDQLDRRTEHMAFAARRAECDWSYTLPEEREEAYNILLPDMQELRPWARLLALKARVEIAEGKPDEATRTLSTGLAMARHLSDAPFLINRLVALSLAGQMLDRVEELIARPGAPNLYWALTALPRPLIELRGAWEVEQRLVEWALPELTGLDLPPLAEEQWEVRLYRLFGRMNRIKQEVGGSIPDQFDEFRAAYLPDATDYFEGREGPGPASDAERIVRYLAERNRSVLDDVFKLAYLPIDEALPEYARLNASEDAEFTFLHFLPATSPEKAATSVRRGHLSQARADRRVAALRVVEAIRLHAAAHDGALPGSLDEIDAVPIPVDPISGEPFSYRLDGDSAILDAPETPLPVDSTRLPYRIPTGLPRRISIRE